MLKSFNDVFTSDVCSKCCATSTSTVAYSDYEPESDCTGLSDTDGNNSDNDICSTEVTIEVRKSEHLRKKGLYAEAEC